MAGNDDLIARLDALASAYPFVPIYRDARTVLTDQAAQIERLTRELTEAEENMAEAQIAEDKASARATTAERERDDARAGLQKVIDADQWLSGKTGQLEDGAFASIARAALRPNGGDDVEG